MKKLLLLLLITLPFVGNGQSVKASQMFKLDTGAKFTSGIFKWHLSGKIEIYGDTTTAIKTLVDHSEALQKELNLANEILRQLKTNGAVKCKKEFDKAVIAYQKYKKPCNCDLPISKIDTCCINRSYTK